MIYRGQRVHFLDNDYKNLVLLLEHKNVPGGFVFFLSLAQVGQAQGSIHSKGQGGSPTDRLVSHGGCWALVPMGQPIRTDSDSCPCPCAVRKTVAFSVVWSLLCHLGQVTFLL